MGLTELLRELRLMKGQAGYRYCLAWFAVLIHVTRMPASLAFVAWLFVASGQDTRAGSPLAQAILWLARSMGR